MQFTFEEKGKYETSNKTKIVLQNFEMFLKLGFALGFSTTDTLVKNYKQNQEDYFKLQMTTTVVAVI